MKLKSLLNFNIVIIIFVFLQGIEVFTKSNTAYPFKDIFISFILLVSLITILDRENKRDISLHNIYLIITLTYGIFFFLLILPNQNFRENSYYMFSDKSFYTPIENLAEFINYLLVSVFGISHLIAYYLVQIINFLIWTILNYYSIKIIPQGKKLLLAVFLLPITMNGQATMALPNLIVSSLGFLFIALLLRYNRYPEIFGQAQKILIALLAIVIPVVKLTYFPLIFLLFFLPQESFKSKFNYIVYIFLLFAMSILWDLAWIRFVTL